tara:strand:+ start:546 stop:1163 length:618 start_codon:yes stop_codon:yes gene_type:complete
MINITKISDDYIMALSALIQSAFIVEKIATSSKEIDNDVKILLESIYKTETFSAENIYGHKRNLSIGLNVLKNILNGNNEIYLMNTQKYALSMMLIQKNISKIKDLQDLIRKKIDNYNENSMMATNFEDLISYSEKIYTEYIAIIRPRVIISGKKEFLEANSSLIRALLLSGIRAAFLWHYHGGSKWQLMFRRSEILNKCNNFFI